jgi:hypothetical protein
VLRLAVKVDLFESAWLKWAWGIVNSDVLGDSVNTLATQSELQARISFAQEYYPKRHSIVVTVHEMADPFFPPVWGLILGDVVHCFRSSLDHLAWALYNRGRRSGTLSESAKRKVQFPICTTSWQDFRDSVKVNVPGILRTDRAIVRQCQPYLRGKTNLDRHVLVVLNDLPRFDKHRTIQPVVAVPGNSDIGIGPAGDCIYRGLAPKSRRTKLEPGTEVARIHVKKTGPEPYIHMQPVFTIDPSINERLTLEEFIVTTTRVIRDILRAFTRPPLSVRAVIGESPTAQSYLSAQRFQPPPPPSA